MNAATREGETPLMNTALGNHAEMVKLLLNARADANAVDAQGCTAQDAAEAGNLKIRARYACGGGLKKGG